MPRASRTPTPTTPNNLAAVRSRPSAEHSYHMDFGAKSAAYVDAFMVNRPGPSPRRLSPGLRLNMDSRHRPGNP